tara:strand:+ start:1421 stop:2347 length:927 start_codon:yes stop_codon:yes gene_type:complete
VKVLITGAAGLVGQNLIPALKKNPEYSIVAMDKHPSNVKILRDLHPEIDVIEADLGTSGTWEEVAAEADSVIQLHAQIGGLTEEEFTRNNITATERLLAACERGKCQYLVHISSSVVNSMAVDFYTESKKAQERLVSQTQLKHVILRPTLMFGWFDRKHLGWLKRFMERAPVFPIPGNGKYLRQPLYVGDFSAVIESCLKHETTGAYDISGQEKVHYIDLIRAIRRVTKQKTPIVKIPYSVFWSLLKVYALFDRNPPFTTQQLKALVTPDVFPVIDWPEIFGVPATDLESALNLTFNHPEYSHVTLEF